MPNIHNSILLLSVAIIASAVKQPISSYCSPVGTKIQYGSASMNEIDKNKDDSLKLVLKKAKDAAFRGGAFAGIAGIVQVFGLMWLRTTVNYQYRYGGTLNAALQELYKQGGIKRFYRGVSYALILGPTSKFGAAAANEGSRVFVESLKIGNGATQLYATLLGTIFASAWHIFLMPLETCKTVLQVDGSVGFANLKQRVLRGHISALYQGSAASILVTACSHYPWFYVYNLLDSVLSKSDKVSEVVIRSAFIGFMASAASDTTSNFVRILKTVKQSMGSTVQGDARATTYIQIINSIYNHGGIQELVGRGLGTRILTNGLQSVIFTVLWKLIPLYQVKRKDTARV